MYKTGGNVSYWIREAVHCTCLQQLRRKTLFPEALLLNFLHFLLFAIKAA